MLLGIDVGGTHTDAVLLSLDGGGAFTVVSRAKAVTDHGNVVASVSAVIESVLEGRDPAGVSRFTLSTTLATNALAQERYGNALLVLVPGPGMDTAEWTAGLPVRVLSGATDHRGRETAPLDGAELDALRREIMAGEPLALAVAAKFATRDPSHETAAAKALASPKVRSVSCSHTLSGMLNFPRRAVAAFYNAALQPVHDAFADAVLEAARNVGGGIEPLLLMAHGGGVPLRATRGNCVEAANSGPAASVLGILALEKNAFGPDEAVLVLDIGGSTTDLAVMAQGSPVTAKEGLILGGRRTSVPGLATASVPVGGDCPILAGRDGTISLDSVRQGPCLAAGGPAATLTDALNVLGEARFGDPALSFGGLEAIARQAGTALGRDLTAQDAARMTADAAAERIRDAAGDFLREINARPVYTVAQFLAGATVRPERLCVAGGAGPSMAGALERAFGLPARPPEHAAFANAIGAALARVSAFTSLYADTARRVAHLLPQGGTRDVPATYSLDQAIADAETDLRVRVRALDPDAGNVPVDLVESDSFIMHDERGNRLGRTIRVMLRVRPGLVVEE